MNKQYDQSQRINSIELIFMMHTVPIGVGVLGMVRFIADKAGHDAPLATMMSGLYPQAGLLFMWLLLRRFQKYGIYEIHQFIFGKWIGRFFNILFAGYCLFCFFMCLRTFTELVGTWMFPLTPVWVLTALFLVPIVYSGAAGVRLLSKFAITSFFLTVWILLLIYYPMQEGGYSHLFPIGANGLKAIFDGSLKAALSLLGPELLLVIYPYVVYKPDVLPAVSIASWGTTLVYTINAVTTIVFFSADQLTKTIWPMLAMYKHVQMPFIERFETIMIAVWLIQIVHTSGSYLWAGVEGVVRSFHLKKSWVHVVLILATLVLSQMLKGRTEVNAYLNILANVGLGVLVFYALLIWIIALILRRKGDAV
ncbi:MAG: GerAB/ArcD/ProY family transporter [Tumebacillaceae bacterium]